MRLWPILGAGFVVIVGACGGSTSGVPGGGDGGGDSSLSDGGGSSSGSTSSSGGGSSSGSASSSGGDLDAQVDSPATGSGVPCPPGGKAGGTVCSGSTPVCCATGGAATGLSGTCVADKSDCTDGGIAIGCTADSCGGSDICCGSVGNAGGGTSTECESTACPTGEVQLCDPGSGQGCRDPADHCRTVTGPGGGNISVCLPGGGEGGIGAKDGGGPTDSGGASDAPAD